jgi:hypothetical protein
LRGASGLFVAALLAAGCTNFADPTTVVDLRMLAVKVEPSEIILDADLSDPANPIVDPASNPALNVTPLIADPAGYGRTVTYTISACPNDPFAPAPPGSGQGGGAFPSGGARTTVGSALCDPSSPKTWLLTADPVAAGSSVDVQPMIDQLTVAFMTDVFPDQFGNLHGGFDLGMPLTLDIKVDAGTEQIRGVKRVLYWAQRIDAAQVPNQLPLIDAVSVFYDRDENTFDPVDPPQTIEEGVPFDVAPGRSSLWIMPAAGNAEPFETAVIDPDTHHAVPFTVPRETLRYRFFATVGSFARAVTSSEPEPGFVATGPIHLESRYRLPDADQIGAEQLVTIWIVVHDDRGGESWVERTLRLRPP